MEIPADSAYCQEGGDHGQRGSAMIRAVALFCACFTPFLSSWTHRAGVCRYDREIEQYSFRLGAAAAFSEMVSFGNKTARAEFRRLP